MRTRELKREIKLLESGINTALICVGLFTQKKREIEQALEDRFDSLELKRAIKSPKKQFCPWSKIKKKVRAAEQNAKIINTPEELMAWLSE